MIPWSFWIWQKLHPIITRKRSNPCYKLGRTDYFLSFRHGRRKLERKLSLATCILVAGYLYNGCSSWFFIRIQGCICCNMEGFMRWASRLLHEMYKPSTVSTGRWMWAIFMHDKLWVWWTSAGSQNLLRKQTRSLLFATTSWSRKVKNSKHQPSWGFLYRIYRRRV